MNTAQNSTQSLATTATTPGGSIYLNLSPLLVLVIVCFVILLCCLCLTSFNSWTKKYHEGQQSAISYGEAQQDHQKFGSVFMTYMPSWMADRIAKAHSCDRHQPYRSREPSISNEKEILLALSRVHYNNYKAATTCDDDCSVNMEASSSKDYNSS